MQDKIAQDPHCVVVRLYLKWPLDPSFPVLDDVCSIATKLPRPLQELFYKYYHRRACVFFGINDHYHLVRVGEDLPFHRAYTALSFAHLV